MGKRKPITNFIQNKWIAMNIRCGKYKHLQTKNKCKSYENISIEFTREQFKKWCLKQEIYIFSLIRPSIDRIDKNKNYTLDNIQIIELTNNIAKEKLVFTETHGICFKCNETKLIEEFVNDKIRQITGKSNICKVCERIRTREKYYRLKNRGLSGKSKKQNP